MADVPSWLGRLFAAPSEKRWARVARLTPIVCGALGAAFAGVTAIYGRPIPTLVWAAALIGIGWLIGFLFAFPRPAARVAGAEGAESKQSSPIQATFPDSMSEVADWLTKIIVGLGLVNLQMAPDKLKELGMLLSGAMTPPAIVGPASEAVCDPSASKRWESFAQGFAVFFLVDGLMLGYLVTRLYLLAALNHADREAADEKTRPFSTDPGDVYGESVEAAVRIYDAFKSAPAGSAAASTPDAKAEATLRSMNSEYCRIHTKDYDSRVVQKNTLMQQMFTVAVAARAPKAWLAEQPGDGYAHVLATMILAEPAAGDLELLLGRAPAVDQRHAQYRVTEAFQRLAEARLAPPTSKDAVKKVIEAYAKDADRSLKGRLDTTRSIIDAMTA